MSLTTRVGFLTGVAAVTLAGSAFADSDTSKDQLLERLAAAEARLAEIERADGDTWLTEQRSEEIKSLVYDVLADADNRASLLQTGMSGGYDNGFILSSGDGNWLLRTNLLMQQRFIYNNQDEEASEDTNRWGFENTRTKFILSGNVVNPQWFYRVDINVGSNSVVPTFASILDTDPGFDVDETGRTGTLNAYLGYDFNNGWKLKAGSMKLPLLREELVEAQHQLTVERSNANYLFTTGYGDGVQIEYTGEQWRMWAMYSDGAGTGQSIWNAADTEFAITGRGEFLVSGTFEQFDDHTSPQGNTNGILIGGAGHYEKGESGGGSVSAPFDLSELEIFVLTADVSFEFDGANIFAAVMYGDVSFGDFDVNPWGVVVQGGVYLAPEWELFGRWEWTDYDIEDSDDLNIGTVGVTRYFAGHNAKWTTDVGFGIDNVLTPSTITGFRADSGDEDGQFVVRSQVQIYF